MLQVLLLGFTHQCFFLMLWEVRGSTQYLECMCCRNWRLFGETEMPILCVPIENVSERSLAIRLCAWCTDSPKPYTADQNMIQTLGQISDNVGLSELMWHKPLFAVDIQPVSLNIIIVHSGDYSC